MSGKFIVIEGVSGVGKTTILKEIAKLISSKTLTYNKGFDNKSLWARHIQKYPHSFTYYLDLAIKTQFIIKPALAKGKMVLQDRYIFSVDSFLPDSKYWYNKIFRKLFSLFFINPDLYICITASTETIISRLNKEKRDNYRLDLAKNPNKIRLRKKEYMRIYKSVKCRKHIIDTTKRTSKQCALELIKYIKSDLKCL